jgi:hypothetical protein
MMMRLTIASCLLALLNMVSARGHEHDRRSDLLEANLAMEDVYAGEIPLNKDKLVEVLIKNTDSRMQEIRQVRLIDDVNGTFRLRDQFIPVGLQPGATLVIRVIINIKRPGTYRTRLMVSTDNNAPPVDTVSAMITAFAVAPPDRTPHFRFAVGSVTATVGDQIAIPLVCLEGGPWLREHGLAGVQCDLRYRRSVLTCNFDDSQAVADDTVRTVRVSLAPYNDQVRANGDTILLIPMTACLGDREVSPFFVSRIVLDIDSEDIKIDTVLRGMVTINDTWPGERTVMRDSLAPVIRIYPNPTINDATVSLHGWQPGAQLHIYAMNGTEVFTWTSTTTEERLDLHLDLNGALAPGVYLCTYLSNDYTAHSSFIVLP